MDRIKQYQEVVVNPNLGFKIVRQDPGYLGTPKTDCLVVDGETGQVTVVGLTLTGDMTLTGDVTLDDLTVGDDAAVGGDLSVAGSVGFYGKTPIAQVTAGANLTNSVTSGGSNNTIANYTDLSTYATDAATIRNNIYQLARSVKIIQDGLRAYGLLS